MSESPLIWFLCARLFSVVIIQTWFVADEYWQANEVAHHLAFGYGYLTWEWKEGIRSAFYPSILASIFKFLQFLRLDYTLILIQIPRIFHAIFFSLGDLYTWKLSRKLYDAKSATWTGIFLASSWFLTYCAPRTISSGPETVLNIIALYYYPWESLRDSTSNVYLYIVGASCLLRPTSAIPFIPFCLKHLWYSAHKIKLIIKYLIALLVVLSFGTIIDSWYYGYLVIVPWNFFRFNVLSGLASHYGSHPWHWYLSQGLPTVLGVHLIPFVLALSKPRRHHNLLPSCVWTVCVYSCLSHKEFRFLLPIVPLCLCIGADYIAQYLTAQIKKKDKAPSKRIVGILLLLFLPSLLMVIYLGLVHQRGPLDAIDSIRKLIHKHQNPYVLYLMPCHSTPYYSHVHRNISMQFLTCEPNLNVEENYLDEADIFDKDPLLWLKKNFKIRNKINDVHMPSHIMMFDILSPKIKSFLEEYKYYLCERIFNSHIIDGRRGKYIEIFCKGI